MKLVEGVTEIEDVDFLIEQLGGVGATHDCVITAFDARYLVGREHVERATRLAKRAVRRGENVADDRSIEILLYAAGRRQIDRALEMGVSAGEGPIVVAVEYEGGDWVDGKRGNTGTIGNADDTENGEAERRERSAVAAVERVLDPGFERVGVLDEYDEKRVHDFFEIGEAELAATEAGVAALVGERVSLLDVEK